MAVVIVSKSYLSHHGILGQKWGRRNGPPYPLNASDHSASEKKAGYQKSIKGGDTDNRKKIVGVFNNRLNRKMNLGSDVTTYYGLQLPQTRDLTKDEFDSVNLYNTRSVTMIGKMPIGPICNPSSSSIEASVFPIDSNYLFFVADKNGKIYFTETNKEHEQKIKEIKASGNWIW